MASFSHHHHHSHLCHQLNSHHPIGTTPISTSYCCTCCCTCTHSHYSCPQSPPPDPLLQAIASQLLHHPPPPASPQPHPNPPYNPQPRHQFQPQHYPPQIHKQKEHRRKYRRQQEDDEEEQETLPVVSSLLRRIAALESSLRHHSPVSFSLRHAAARTIQTHFRAFLVRRSRTLRQLQDLAFIKSSLSNLKSSLSEATHFDYQAISQETIRLLLKLESIQGGDPMIGDGKRSITRELVQFMEFIDEVSVKRRVLYSSRAVKNVGFGKSVTKSKLLLGDHGKRNVDSGSSSAGERKLLEKLRSCVKRIENFSRAYEDEDEEGVCVGDQCVSVNVNRGVSQNRIGGLVKRQGGGVQVQVQPKAKKNVSFVENGNVYKVIQSSHSPGSSGDSASIDESDLVDVERGLMNNCREMEEIGVSAKEVEEDNEEGTTEGSESPAMSGDERDSARNMRAGGDYNIRNQEEDDSFLFSAPLPVKMEPRADLMSKKQPLKK